MSNAKMTARDRSVDDAMVRYAGGDDRAFADVYAVIAPRLTRFLAARVGNKADLPDLVQETLLRIHRARRSFVRGSAVAWALTIARNQLIDAHRRGDRTEQIDLDRLDSLAGSSVFRAPPTGEEIVMAKETGARLDRVLSAIPESQRTALHLVRGEGLSVAEAAAALCTTTTAISLRTHRACRALQAELAEDLAAA